MGGSIADPTVEDLYEEAPCGYLSTAPDGMIHRVNTTFLRWTGYRREDLVGVRRFQDLLTVGGRIYHETHFSPLLRMQGAAREIAVELVCADGRRLPALVNSILRRDAEGEPLAVLTTVIDATERKAYERELLAARDRERLARERVERLQRITAALAAAPDARGLAAAVLDELVPAFSPDRAGVAVRGGEDDAPRVILRHGEASPADLVDPGAAARFDDRTARVPLGSGTGWLWLGFDAARELDQAARVFLVGAAQQTGLALERSRLYEETRDVALTLQRSMLGDAPADPRFVVAAHYSPAVENLEVGGDWYDAFELPDGRVGIVVGDVVGRGLPAATAMGQLRSAVRALAGAGMAPGVLLTHLDTFVEQVESARYATLAYAAVDPDAGVVELGSAGHLPIVLLGDGEPALFMEGRSPPLGVPPDGVRTQATFVLPPGSGFLLYTDGLVERRAEPIDAGLERLLAAIRESPDASPAALAERLPRILLGGGSDDDVCVLGFRLAGP